ncbi:MAG: hypothetical protein J2P54_04325 [Bradyrhizobiaceae bacterium]|nr:hypothetical protein [Bradyrhizobiaceae bacterium]
MTRMTKSALAAVLIAAVATPVLAQAKQSERVIEGRNAAVVHDLGAYNGTSTDRNSVVQSLGN